MRQLAITFRGREFNFLTDDKLFSPNQLDAGTRLLLETVKIPDAVNTILDLGCGWGAIGIILARLHPKLFVYLLDNDPKALFCAEKNLKINSIKNTKVLKGNVSYTTLPKKFDVILTNPPWTKNRSVTPKLIEFAANHLAKGGSFYLVINQTYQAEYQIEKFFGNVQTITKSHPYKILLGRGTATDPNDLLDWTKSALERTSITPNPLTGQHFLTDSSVISRLVSEAKVKKTDTALEIGPGLGAITKELAESASKVIAIEIDKRFKHVLTELPKNVTVIYDDFFKVFRPAKPPFKFTKIVANLPYLASGSILLKLARRDFDSAVFILPSKLGRKLQSGYLKEFFSAKKLFDISRAFFYPMPDADSVVIKLQKKGLP